MKSIAQFGSNCNHLFLTATNPRPLSTLKHVRRQDEQTPSTFATKLMREPLVFCRP